MTTMSDYDDGAEAKWSTEATGRMNRMYRWQRYIYDATRRYYLLGRDELIDGIKPSSGACVLEIGCGTGRNLVHAARKYPGSTFYGIDVSTEMLTTAIAAIERRDLVGSVRVAHGDATSFDPAPLFGITAFDHVMISYSLSMIPAWHEVIENAVSRLKPGGQLHIVDFGNQERLPAVVRTILLRWLTLFDVTPRPDMQDVFMTVAADTGATLAFERPYRGYAQSAVLTKRG
jgi:S-adenosylmethionine-diacylgycerolhomoserine-N-methlytransferase